MKRLPSKMRMAEGYQRSTMSVKLVGSSKTVQPSPVGDAQGSKMRMAWFPGLILGLPSYPCWSPPTLTY